MRIISIMSVLAVSATALIVATAADAAGRGWGRGGHGGGFHRGGFAGPRGGYGRVAYNGGRRGYGYGAAFAAGVVAGEVAEASAYGADVYATPSRYSYNYYAPVAAPVYAAQTVMEPVTRTRVVPVTSYRTVQETRLRPRTVLTPVVQNCQCVVNGVISYAPCTQAGYGVTGGYGVQYYSRAGLFTSSAW